MEKIMIVDDDVSATTLIEKIIRMEGYEATSLNDSSRALEVAASVHPDLFILDLMMPEPTGFQLCRMLRATSEFRFTPIIIVTALDDSDSKVVAFGAGANDYLTKPFRIEDLTSRVGTLLGRAKEEE